MMRYCNADYDKQITAALNSADPKVYEPIMANLNKITNTELPWILGYQDKSFRVVGPKVDASTVKVGMAYNWEDIQLWTMK